MSCFPYVKFRCCLCLQKLMRPEVYIGWYMHGFVESPFHFHFLQLFTMCLRLMAASISGTIQCITIFALWQRYVRFLEIQLPLVMYLPSKLNLNNSSCKSKFCFSTRLLTNRQILRWKTLKCVKRIFTNALFKQTNEQTIRFKCKYIFISFHRMPKSMARNAFPTKNKTMKISIDFFPFHFSTNSLHPTSCRSYGWNNHINSVLCTDIFVKCMTCNVHMIAAALNIKQKKTIVGR